jgi:transposase
MGRAVTGRADYTSGEVRRLARRAKDAAQARRLLAIAAVLDGASRSEAAKIGGMDRQTLRVIRFNDQGPDGLINIPSSGVPPKLDTTHRAFLARIVEEGPTPAIHGVVRWRACDLIMRLHEEFGLAVSDDTIYRALKDLGFSHVSARPKAYKQDTEARGGVQKKLCRTHGGSPRGPRARHTDRGVVPGRDARQELRIPANISLLPLPPRAPELNSQENIWQFMRQNWLSNRIFKSFDDIVDHCCYA